jgi:hypothetical protein
MSTGFRPVVVPTCTGLLVVDQLLLLNGRSRGRRLGNGEVNG